MTHDEKAFTSRSGYMMPETQSQLLEKAGVTSLFVRNKALSDLIILYWKPIYRHIRRK